MCVVSMIFEQYYPIQPYKWVPQVWDNTVKLTYDAVKPKTPLDIFEELVAKAKELDDALGLADCEDPKKMAWLDKVRKTVKDHELKKIEDRLNK